MRPEQDALIEVLYRSHFHTLEIHAYRFLGNWDDSHVAAQETFYIACEKIDVLMNAPSQIGWLKAVTKYVCKNMLRARKRQLLLFSSLEAMSETDLPSSDDHLTDLPGEFLTGLISDDEYTLLKRIVIDGISYVEAAKELDISMWACRKRVQRIIDKIHKKYREKFGENFSL